MAIADSLRRRPRPAEAAIKGLLIFCGLVSIATTVGILASLLFETREFFSVVSFREFFTGTRWAPTFSQRSFGVLPLVSATLLITAIGAAVALPIGLGVAIYLSEYSRRRVRRILKPMLEILAGIPTVVFGYFALTFVTPNILKPLIPGMENRVFNALSAGLVIGIAIVPLVASISEDAMRAVPRALREAAYGMGATRRTVALRVVVPAALSGIVAAFILGVSRAVGETMIVALASGNVANLSADPREPMATMTAFIVQMARGDTPVDSIPYRTIFALGTTLFAMTLVLNAASLRIGRKFRERYE